MSAIYKDMRELLEEKEQGVARLAKFRAEGFAAAMAGIPTGDYIKLIVDGELMMSNTPMEKRTSADFVINACGDVLICGLGIGLVIMPLLEAERVKTITVVEKYQDVIDIVLPQIKPYDKHNKLKVICADCFDYCTKEKFDTIFIDIWASINRDIYEEEMKPLKSKYKKFLKAERRKMANVFVWAEYNARYEVQVR